jgi:hypothetical protein
MHHLESLIQAIPAAVFAAGGSPAFAMPIDGSSPISQLGNSPTPSYPASQPPPSVNLLSITGPSAHFGYSQQSTSQSQSQSQPSLLGIGTSFSTQSSIARRNSLSFDQLSDETARMTLYSSYLYIDDEGYTRWQGETSGLPICDFLVERHQPSPKIEPRDATPPQVDRHVSSPYIVTENWFPDRQAKRTELQPERNWKLITSTIPPDLMDG